MATHDEMRMNSGVLLLLSAPSGGGKTTVMQGLLAANPNLRRVITCTTRPPRDGERDGFDYHFLTPEEFERRATRNEFLEHAVVYGRRYGSLKASVLDLLAAGHDVVMSLDVQGAESVRQLASADAVLRQALVTVFLTPPNLDELAARLRGRNADSAEVIARRLETARAEIAQWRRFDYLVVSGSRDADLRRVQEIYAAEKLRVARCGFELRG